MKIIKITLVVLIAFLSMNLAYAQCGPLPGGSIWLSHAINGKGNFYLTKAHRLDRPFFIVNDTSQAETVRICVAPTTDWWTTVLNNECEQFTYPSSEIDIANDQGNIYEGYSAGRCDAIITIEPRRKLTLTIVPRLRASSGSWQIENRR